MIDSIFSLHDFKSNHHKIKENNIFNKVGSAKFVEIF